MKIQLAVALALFPAFTFAQKPDCETIRKIVTENRESTIKKLESEVGPLEKLKNDIRRGRGKLEGKDGMKPAREQLKIVMEKMEAIDSKIEEAKKSISLPRFKFGELKVGHFGESMDDFRIQEILDDKSFTAFHQYIVHVPNRGGITAYRPELRLSQTLYLVKGIETKGLVDGKPANWKGNLYCSGTKKLKLNSGNETVFVLEPFDVETCLTEIH